MTAEQYNLVAYGKLWSYEDMPPDLQEIIRIWGAGSLQFASAVSKRQRKYKLSVDGKLGDATLETMRRNENLRRGAPAGKGWMTAYATPLASKRQEPARTKPVMYVICHTTGSGVYQMVPKWGPDPFTAAVNYYRSPSAYTSHFISGLAHGQFAQVASVDEVAFHAGVGTEGTELYRSGKWKSVNYPMTGGPIALTPEQTRQYYGWWLDKWGTYTGGSIENPLKLTNGDPNGYSVGFDFLAYPYGGDYTDWQFDCLARVCVYLRDNYKFVISDRTVLTHSETHPIQRCNKNGGWDPGPKFSTERLYKAIARIGG